MRAWAQEHLESEIIAIEPVGGGRTDTISAVYLLRGEPVILRYVSIERWSEIGRQNAIDELARIAVIIHGTPVARVRRRPIRDWFTGIFIQETSCGKAIGLPA